MGRKKGLGTHLKQRENVQRPCGEKHGEEESRRGQCAQEQETKWKLVCALVYQECSHPQESWLLLNLHSVQSVLCKLAFFSRGLTEHPQFLLLSSLVMENRMTAAARHR